MSCSSPLTFPNVTAEKVAQPSWLEERLTGFERLTGGFINLIHPSELPFDELVNISVAEGGELKVETHLEMNNLLYLAEQHELVIAVIAVLPFVLLLLMGFCYCLLCMERCLCCKKAKPKEKSLTTPIVFLFLSGTMLSVAVYAITSSKALDDVINGFPDELISAVNYIPLYANKTKKILDRLLSSDLDIFTQHMDKTAMRGECILEHVAVGNHSQSLKTLFDTFGDKQKETESARERFEKNCAAAAGQPLCKEETSKLQSGIPGIKSLVGSAARKALGLLKQATQPLKAVRDMSNNLVSSASQANRFSELVLKYKATIEQYDEYRSAITSTYALVMFITSLGLFISAVLLLFSLGPEGAPCRPPMSKSCIKRLLVCFTCFAHVIAFFGSIVFLVFFFLGANLHLACRPLQDVEAAKGFVGTFSKVADQYLHTRLKSILANTTDSGASAIFGADEISKVIKELSVASIIHDCKARKTIFVILKLDTLDFPSKLSHMFERQLQGLVEGGGKTQGEAPPDPSKERTKPHPMDRPSRPEHRPDQSGDRASEGAGHRVQPGRDNYAGADRTGDQQKRSKRDTGVPPYGPGKVRGHPLGGKSPDDDKTRSGSTRKDEHDMGAGSPFNPQEFTQSFQELQVCLSTLTQGQAEKFPGCSGNEYNSLCSNLKSLVNISSPIAGACPSIDKDALKTSIAQLAKETVIYGKHVNHALKEQILPCDVVIYSIGGLVNTVCWHAVRTINCWNFACGLWCYLVIFTVCYSRSVRGMLVVPRQKKPSEESEHTQ